MRFQNKTVIITGAGQGLGRAYAFRFAEEGAKVVIAEIDIASAEQTVADLHRAGYEAIATRTDVAKFASCQEMANRTVEAFGQIHVLVNNAALFAAILPFKAWDAISQDEWDRVMTVNVRGTWNCVRAVYPHMEEHGYGRIVNVSSSAVMSGTAGFAHYVASKAAIIGLTRSIAREIGDTGITINAIAPGLTSSEGAKSGYTIPQLDAAAGRRSLKRHQEPEDLVGVVAFLASDDARFMTGQTVNVDGGTNMY